MAAIAWFDVAGDGTNGVAPELFTFPVAAQTLVLLIVNGGGLDVNNLDGEAGNLTKAARVFLAAHMATLIKRRGTPGAIASQSEGGAAQSYAMSFANPRTLDLTSYGSLLRQLVMGSPARAGALL